MTFDDVNADGGMESTVASHVGGDGNRAARREVHERLRSVAQRRGGLDVEEARWLLVAERLEVFRDHDCATIFEYLERVLGHKPAAAAERLRVAAALEVLPVTRAALGEGAITYSTVRELRRCITPATEAAWVDAVRGKTARQVEALVAGRKLGDRPEDPADPDLRMRVVRLELSPESYALWCEAQKRIDAPDDSALVAALCRAALVEDVEATGDRAPAPRYQIATTVCAQCKRGWQDGGSQVIEVGPEAIARACCDAQELGRVDVETGTPTTTTIPQAIRTRVFRRDHRRCVVPGCRAGKYLEIHHVVFREHGGDHRMSNLCVACASHHDDVHQGRLVIRGDANVGLEFVGADGRPWGAPTWESTAALVRSGLRNAGFKPPEATAAVERAVAELGCEAGVEALLRAALQACPRPRSG